MPMNSPSESKTSDAKAPVTRHGEEFVPNAERGRATWDQAAWRPRLDLGLAVCGLGLGLILWGVSGVLAAAYGPEPPRNFAERRSYDQVKPDVHAAFPTAMVRALSGVLVVGLGARMRRRAR